MSETIIEVLPKKFIKYGTRILGNAKVVYVDDLTVKLQLGPFGLCHLRCGDKDMKKYLNMTIDIRYDNLGYIRDIWCSNKMEDFHFAHEPTRNLLVLSKNIELPKYYQLIDVDYMNRTYRLCIDRHISQHSISDIISSVSHGDFIMEEAIDPFMIWSTTNFDPI